MRNIDIAPDLVRPAATRIGRLHSAMAGVMHDLLTELASFADDELWREDGATDMVSWLTYELGLLPRTARAWMEVARRLGELPELRRRLVSGELSLEQVRALCKIATPEDEIELADIAAEMTAAEVERMVRKARQITTEELEDNEPQRSLTWFWQPDERFLHLNGVLPAAEGALVEKALLRLSAQEAPDPGGRGWRPLPERAADALALMASEALGRDGDPDRATLVVHVSAEHLAAATGPAVVEHGPVIAIETARRLACDSNWLISVDTPEGTPIGVGRRTRRIPLWLGRMVSERDEGCRFPGCGRTRWTHAHHINHWANGGPTDLDNLVTLCGYHHRMLHNEGWQIRGNPNGEIDWIHPRGWTLTPARHLSMWNRTATERLREIDGMYERRIAAAL